MAALTLLLPLTSVPVRAAGPGCTSPPAAFDLSELTLPLAGVGYTTIAGSTPTTFEVDVLGVIPDAIMLDIDLIVARITGPSAFFDEAGGVFYGMSGSPVYVNGDKDSGELLGAVSYSYWPDQTIVGLTPAQPMLDLFDLPTSSRPEPAGRVALTPRVERAIVAAGATVSADADLKQMPTILGAALSPQRLRQFRRHLRQNDAHVRVVQAGRASATAGLPVSGNGFELGEPVSSVISYGDASIWAAGTVTIVCCNDQIAMYGHPLFWDVPGPVTLGLNGVEVLGVSHSAAWWNEMIPVVSDIRGSVTADRFAGEIGEVGLEPSSVPIVSQATSPDTGRSRSGRTDAVFTDGWWFEEELWIHLVRNLDHVFQRIGPGTLDLAWTIDLQDEPGTSYLVTNRTKYHSMYDAVEGMWHLLAQIEQLTYGRFGPVTFTGLEASASITQDDLTGEIVRVRAASGLQPTLAERRVTRVRPGRPLTIEVTQEPAEDGADVVTTFQVKVPKRLHGRHRVVVRGGEERYWIDDDQVGSLEELVAALSGGEHADEVIVEGLGPAVSQLSPLIVEGWHRFSIEVVR